MIDLESVRSKVFEGLKNIFVLNLYQEPSLPIVKEVEGFKIEDVEFNVFAGGEEWTEETYFNSIAIFRNLARRHHVLWTSNKSLAKKCSIMFNDERAVANGWS